MQKRLKAVPPPPPPPHTQSVFGPLLKLEADYDRAMKENQAREGVAIHWGVGLNKRTVARFYFPKDSADMRLMIGGSKGGSGADGRRVQGLGGWVCA